MGTDRLMKHNDENLSKQHAIYEKYKTEKNLKQGRSRVKPRNPNGLFYLSFCLVAVRQLEILLLYKYCFALLFLKLWITCSHIRPFILIIYNVKSSMALKEEVEEVELIIECLHLVSHLYGLSTVIKTDN